jgi:AcrR family transcriptional regulator
MSSMSDMGPRRAVLDAALRLFGRYGFQRASMADIAREAGIARATLYLKFNDKRAVFDTLAALTVTDALAAAEAAWKADAPLAENLAATLIAKDEGFHRLINATPHGAELLEVDAELTRAHVAHLDQAFAALLTRRAEEAGGADLSAFEGAEGFGRFLATTAAGLKHELRDEAAWRRAVARLARVVARAAGL